jgi:hypothetical protein
VSVDQTFEVRPGGTAGLGPPVAAIPVFEPLAALLPQGLRRGETVALTSRDRSPDYLALALLAGALAAGLWCAAVGVPDLGGVALAELLSTPSPSGTGAPGVSGTSGTTGAPGTSSAPDTTDTIGTSGTFSAPDTIETPSITGGLDDDARDAALDRLLLVPEPGERWAELAAGLADGVDLLLVRPPGAVSADVGRRVDARLRQGRASGTRHSAAMLVLGNWANARLVLRTTHTIWTGLNGVGPSAGTGHLTGGRGTVVAEGRATAGRPRTVRLWLPAADGAARTLIDVQTPAATTVTDAATAPRLPLTAVTAATTADATDTVTVTTTAKDAAAATADATTRPPLTAVTTDAVTVATTAEDATAATAATATRPPLTAVA